MISTLPCSTQQLLLHSILMGTSWQLECNQGGKEFSNFNCDIHVILVSLAPGELAILVINEFDCHCFEGGVC